MKQSYKDLSIFFAAAMSASFSPIALADYRATESSETQEANAACVQLLGQDKCEQIKRELECESDQSILESLISNWDPQKEMIPRDLEALIMNL